MKSLRAAPLLVVLTARDGAEVDPAIAQGIDDIERIGVALRPSELSVSLIATLLRTIDASVAHPQAQEVAELTGGNPLLVHELLAHGLPGQISEESMRSVLELRLRDLTRVQREVITFVALLGSFAEPAAIAGVMGLAADEVEAALAGAEEAAVLVRESTAVRLSHDLLAQAMLAALPPRDLARMHDRAATGLAQAGTRPNLERLAEIARHRIAVAELRGGAGDVVAAGEAARAAAAHLLEGMAYESASQLLRLAVRLFDRAELSAPVDLLLDTARSELSAGNLATARLWFRRAADEAVDPEALANAALGLGGVWVCEHRQTLDHAAFMSLLERALAGLGDSNPTLAARLRVRQAAEHAYVGRGRVDSVAAAVEEVRALDDPLVLAEALSLLHHTMLGPANSTVRKPIADEVLHNAAEAGDGLLTLMGIMWRTIDLLLTGDPRARRALVELREQADALQVAAVLFVVDALDVMLLVRQGRLEEAVAAAEGCFQLGSAIGDADAVGYLGAHMLTIRWLQERPDDLLPVARSIAESPFMVDGDVAYPAAVAVFAAMAGEDDEARAALHRVMQMTPALLETSSNWMISMFSAAEACALLGDAATAQRVYAALEPYASLPIMGSIGVVCLGSAHRSLAVAAAAAGDLDLAIAHAEQAIEQNHRIGNSVMAAISEGDLGRWLLGREHPGDIERGLRHAENAASELLGLGLDARAQRLAELAGRHGAATAVAAGEMVRNGSVWQLRCGDATVELADTVGVHRLVHLLERPFIDVPATELVGGVQPDVRHEMIDTTALRSYHDRVRSLRRDIDAAEDDHDLERAAMLRDELDALLTHLSSNKTLAGRSRAFANNHERARVAVRKSLSRVFDEVSAQAPQFAAALAASIRTGSTCRFHPKQRFPSVWHRSDTR